MIANISLYTSNTKVSTKFTVHCQVSTSIHSSTYSFNSFSIQQTSSTSSLHSLSFIINHVGFYTLDIKYQPLQYTSKFHFNVPLQCYTSNGSSSSSYTLHTAYF